MRKLFVILGILSVSATFAGCGGFGGFSDEPELTYHEGILTEQVTIDARKGSHILTNDDEGLPLRSASLNLSNSEYLDNLVQVVGVYDSDDDVFEVTGISVLEILVAKPGEAAFVAYKNTDLGFEVKYYEDWPFKEWQNGDVEFIKAGSDTSVKVSQFPFDYVPNVTEDGNVDTPLTSFKNERFKDEDLGPVFKVGSDKQDAIQYSDDGLIAYYLYRNGLIYELSFSNTEHSNEDKMVFNEMLNTFKFTGFTVDGDNVDASSTDEEPMTDVAESFNPIDLPAIDSEFSSFSSLPYHFTASYPAGWYYSGGSGGGDVLWHYGFRDEADEDSDTLVSLDVVKSIPSGKSISMGPLVGVKVVSGDSVSIYAEIEDQKYRASGDKELEAILLVMVSSIEATDLEL